MYPFQFISISIKHSSQLEIMLWYLLVFVKDIFDWFFYTLHIRIRIQIFLQLNKSQKAWVEYWKKLLFSWSDEELRNYITDTWYDTFLFWIKVADFCHLIAWYVNSALLSNKCIFRIISLQEFYLLKTVSVLHLTRGMGDSPELAKLAPKLFERVGAEFVWQKCMQHVAVVLNIPSSADRTPLSKSET